MVEEKVKYANLVEESKKKWEQKSPEEKAAWDRMFRRGAERFVLLWDIIKRVEKEFNIDLMGILRDEVWKHSFEAGQNLAKKFKTHGVKDLYVAFNGPFEGLANPIWLEFNDKVSHKWNQSCPNIQHYRDLGKTDEEIKEMAPYICLADIGIMQGFNPKLHVFHQTRLIMLGDSHCVYRVEDHGGE